jgi:hypothetical protein
MSLEVNTRLTSFHISATMAAKAIMDELSFSTGEVAKASEQLLIQAHHESGC